MKRLSPLAWFQVATCGCVLLVTSAHAQAAIDQTPASRSAPDALDPLRAAQKRLEQDPSDVDARRLQAAVLSDLGARYAAQAVLDGTSFPIGSAPAPLIATPATLSRPAVPLTGASPATAANPPSPQGTSTSDALRHHLTDRGLAQQVHWADWDAQAADQGGCGTGYDHYDMAVSRLADALRDPALSADRRAALTGDRWVALDKAGRYGEVLAEWDAKGRPQDLAPYAARAVADALAVYHRPAEAYALLDRANHQDPGPYDQREQDPRQALAWADYDRDHRNAGRRAMEGILHAEPSYFPLTMPPQYKENAFGISADQNTWDMRADQGELKRAQAGMKALTDAAPTNAGLLQDLGGITARRGQVRQGQAILARAQTLDPTYMLTQVAWVGTDAQRHDAPSVEARLAPIVCRYPRSPVVIRAQQDWARQKGWQFDTEIRGDKGNSPDSGDRSWESDTTAWSPLLANHWRVGALYRTAYADLPEGGTWRNRVGAGVRYEARDVVAYADVLVPQHTQTTRKPAIEAGVDWSLSDQWSVGVAGSTAGVETPLRAEAYGISAKNLTLATTWSPSDETRVVAKAGKSWFTDGNQRHEWSLIGAQRVLTRPDWTLDATAEISGSTNSRLDRPYYDPANDHAYLGGLVAENVMHAWGDQQRVTQRFEIQAGPYREHGYGSHWLATVGYGQKYQWAPGRTWGWQVGYRSQTYDGQREHAWTLNLTAHWGE